jgi:hypothetical protein
VLHCAIIGVTDEMRLEVPDEGQALCLESLPLCPLPLNEIYEDVQFSSP